MNKKIIIIIVSFIMSMVVFTGMITIQKKLLNPNGTEKIYVVIKNADKNQVFKESDIDTYFTLKEISKDQIIEGAIKDKKDLIDTYAKENLYKGEVATSYRVEENSKRLNIENKREYSLKFSDIGEVVGGILKEGDMIDIISTESMGGIQSIKTKTILKNAYIDKVFSADGNRINRTDGNKNSALTLNLIISATDGHILDNSKTKGKLKVMKVLDDTTYNDINVQVTN